MIKVENISVHNLDGAVRGMRNPLNSWDKSDSHWLYDIPGITFDIGPKDLDLMRRLFKGGTEHRKYLRQVQVSFDLSCHHIFWSEFDTYKVGVTRNSCSKMHTIHVKSFEPDDFSHEGISEVGGKYEEHFRETLKILEELRLLFNGTHEKKYWRALLESLPMGYNLKATITMNYENVVNIINQRTGHKIDEWNEFVEILRTLPYIEEIMRE